MKVFAAVVLIFFSFALNSSGQKIKLKNTEIYVDGKLYGFIQPVSKSELFDIIKNGINPDFPKRSFPFIGHSSFAILSLNKSLIALIFPEPKQLRPSRSSPPGKTVLFYPDRQPRSLQYSKSYTIESIIREIASFELINNNIIDKSALRRLFEKYGKEVKYSDFRWRQIENSEGCGTMSQYKSIYPDFPFPIWQFNGKEKSINIDNRFIAKFDSVLVRQDSLITKASFFDQFNTFKASITLVDAVGDNYNNYIFPVREIPNKSKNDFFKLNYKLVTNKGEVRFFTVQVIFDNYQQSQIPPEEKSLTPKFKSQLIKIGEYLQNSYYL